MSIKHTPGPWYALDYGGYINLQTEDCYSEGGLLDLDKDENAVDNGLLAAASPDLKAALDAVIAAFPKEVLKDQMNEDYHLIEAAYEKINL